MKNQNKFIPMKKIMARMNAEEIIFNQDHDTLVELYKILIIKIDENIEEESS